MIQHIATTTSFTAVDGEALDILSYSRLQHGEMHIEMTVDLGYTTLSTDPILLVALFKDSLTDRVLTETKQVVPPGSNMLYNLKIEIQVRPFLYSRDRLCFTPFNPVESECPNFVLTRFHCIQETLSVNASYYVMLYTAFLWQLEPDELDSLANRVTEAFIYDISGDVMTTTTTTATTTTSTTTDPCFDIAVEFCADWSASGYCNNAVYVQPLRPPPISDRMLATPVYAFAHVAAASSHCSNAGTKVIWSLTVRCHVDFVPEPPSQPQPPPQRP